MASSSRLTILKKAPEGPVRSPTCQDAVFSETDQQTLSSAPDVEMSDSSSDSSDDSRDPDRNRIWRGSRPFPGPKEEPYERKSRLAKNKRRLAAEKKASRSQRQDAVAASTSPPPATTLPSPPLTPAPTQYRFASSTTPLPPHSHLLYLAAKDSRSSSFSLSPSTLPSVALSFPSPPLSPATPSHTSKTKPSSKSSRLPPRVGRNSNQPSSFQSISSSPDSSSSSASSSAAPSLPLFPRQPPAWGFGRQELCEALPWWRAFQSGLYMKDGVAMGYLLDGFGSSRDVWAADGRVVISHGGGKCVSVPRQNPSGETEMIAVLREDQSSKDPRVHALLQAHRNRTPIGLLVGKHYPLLPMTMEVGYAVLGWYWISQIWIEAEEGAPGSKPVPGRDFFHRYKIRFDWISYQGDPWWIHSASCPVKGWSPFSIPKFDAATCSFAITSPRPSKTQAVAESTGEEVKKQAGRRRLPGEGGVKAIRVERVGRLAVVEDSVAAHTSLQLQTCAACGLSTPSIYREGWMCLETECASYWLLVDTHEPDRLVPPGPLLTYLSDFLLPRPTPQHLKNVPYPLAPPPPICPEELDVVGSRAGWVGIVCPNCGRASSRQRWDGWACPSCFATYSPIQPIIRARDIDSLAITDHLIVGGSVEPGSGIIVHTSLLKVNGLVEGLVTSYVFPSSTGVAVHFRSLNTDTRRRCDGIFEAYQLDLDGEEGGKLGPAKLFRRHALKQHMSIGQLLGQQFYFNCGADYKFVVEVDSVGFDRAPQAVLISLDLITERVEQILGWKEQFNEVLSVAYREEQQMNYHDDGETGLGPVVASLSLGGATSMHFRPKVKRSSRNLVFSSPSSLHDSSSSSATTSESKAEKKEGKATKAELTLRLEHGDVMVMLGEGIQREWEHMVETPEGFRVAATARRIGKGHR